MDKITTRLNAVVKQSPGDARTQLVNACDAGREGELLISRTIEQYAGGNKPLGKAGPAPVAGQSMDAAGDPRRFRLAAASSRCRAWPTPRACAPRPTGWWHQRHAGDDGLQLRDGGFFLTTVGRVQTPTLSGAGVTVQVESF